MQNFTPLSFSAAEKSVTVQQRPKMNDKLECGLVSNVMAALKNIGGALSSTPQGLADAQYWIAVQ